MIRRSTSLFFSEKKAKSSWSSCCYISAVSFFLRMTLWFCSYASVIIIRCGFLQCSWTKSFLFPLLFHPIVMMIAWGLAGMSQHHMRYCFKCPRTCLFQARSSNLSLKQECIYNYVILVCLWKMGISHSVVISVWHICKGSKTKLLSHFVLIIAKTCGFLAKITLSYAF